jgi:hypothetical protein
MTIDLKEAVTTYTPHGNQDVAAEAATVPSKDWLKSDPGAVRNRVHASGHNKARR